MAKIDLKDLMKKGMKIADTHTDMLNALVYILTYKQVTIRHGAFTDFILSSFIVFL